MTNGIKIGLAFLSGLAIGAFAMKKFIDHNYEYVSEDEPNIEENDTIEEFDVSEDLEAAFAEKENIVASTKETRIDYSKIKSVNDAEYTRILDELRYSVDKEAEENKVEPIVEVLTEVDRSKPYRINPDEFEELDEYESDEYTYYTDGYVTDSYGLPVSDEDIEATIGLDFESYFDETGEDQIYIRNEQRSMDFSVIRDVDKFVDVAPPRIKRMVGL